MPFLQNMSSMILLHQHHSLSILAVPSQEWNSILRSIQVPLVYYLMCSLQNYYQSKYAEIYSPLTAQNFCHSINMLKFDHVFKKISPAHIHQQAYSSEIFHWSAVWKCDANSRFGRGEIIKHFVTEKLPPHTQGSVCRNETLIHNWKHSVMKSKD